LRRHLAQKREAKGSAAGRFAGEIICTGLRPSELTAFQERFLLETILPRIGPGQRSTLIRRAATFLSHTIIPPGTTASHARTMTRFQRSLVASLGRRAVDLAAVNQGLAREIARREISRRSLAKRERSRAEILERCDRQQKQLRRLSGQILSVQEDERRRISRELHDVIAQTLSCINMRLAALKKQASLNTRTLERTIDRTQKLVERSVKRVHQFARELRPAVLDDLGLIPALRACLRQFSRESGVKTRLVGFTGLEHLGPDHRTVLYRVAQEAITNIARHARATHASISIERCGRQVRMRVADDGRAFDAERVLRSSTGRQLGLLGMRERVVMVGGVFRVTSVAGTGTVVEVLIPFERIAKARTTPGRIQRKVGNPDT
jgi:signal transduction histidine kinase